LAAHKGRYLAFKPDEDGQATRLHGRLPFAEARQLESQLRKIADRLGLGDKERPSPSARMADALLIMTKGSASAALHKFEKSSTPHTSSAPGPGFSTETSETAFARSSGTVIDYDIDPFPESNTTNGASDFDGLHDHAKGPFGSPSESLQVASFADAVQRADTRLIIHWNAASGGINFENGPPVDHPRLQAILCDAQIDIQHCGENGLPTGLITTQHHATWRQERYLAFRDGVCRMPECEGIGKTHSHHMFDDRADRVTDVRSMISLCCRDHQQHHDGVFTITGDREGTIVFNYRDGTVLSSTVRPTPKGMQAPKPQPFAKHPTDTQDLNEFPMSA
jgi:hypothetical protein